METLILYYSYSGNTQKIAEYIYQETGGDMLEIATQEPYAGTYNDVVDQGKREIENGFLPELCLPEMDWAHYGTVILGAPVWWYTFAPAMRSFLQGRDFSGKRVHPFATSGGWPGHVLADFARACTGADMQPGLDVRFDGQRLRTPEKSIRQCAKEIAKAK